MISLTTVDTRMETDENTESFTQDGVLPQVDIKQTAYPIGSEERSHLEKKHHQYRLLSISHET